jgi:hypothetical protein
MNHFFISTGRVVSLVPSFVAICVGTGENLFVFRIFQAVFVRWALVVDLAALFVLSTAVARRLRFIYQRIMHIELSDAPLPETFKDGSLPHWVLGEESAWTPLH